MLSLLFVQDAIFGIHRRSDECCLEWESREELAFAGRCIVQNMKRVGLTGINIELWTFE